MAKLTVYFKDQEIQSSSYDSGNIHIGRDDHNDLIIDSPSAAPAHAVVIISSGSYSIKQLNENHPLIVNNKKTKETLLQNNDAIAIDQHTIIFTLTESIAPPQDNELNEEDIESLNKKLEENIILPDANLQVLDGAHIGRILPLKKAMTRFRHGGSGIVIISKRKDGYFISSLENDIDILVNQQPLSDKTIHLNNNDIVLIDNISMQFFLETES